MHDQAQLKKIEEFIKAHDLAVIATVNKDYLPEAAVLGFAEKNGFELIIGTFRTSRKYQNFQHNANVALVIGWDQGKTVQYEGQVVELSGEELEECKQIHLAKIPTAAKWMSETDARFMKIVPKWIKYSDWSKEIPEEFEVKF